jgi:hypothetical protein
MKIVDIARITSRPFEFILQFILGKKKKHFGRYNSLHKFRVTLCTTQTSHKIGVTISNNYLSIKQKLISRSIRTCHPNFIKYL